MRASFPRAFERPCSPSSNHSLCIGSSILYPSCNTFFFIKSTSTANTVHHGLAARDEYPSSGRAFQLIRYLSHHRPSSQQACFTSSDRRWAIPVSRAAGCQQMHERMVTASHCQPAYPHLPSICSENCRGKACCSHPWLSGRYLQETDTMTFL